MHTNVQYTMYKNIQDIKFCYAMAQKTEIKENLKTKIRNTKEKIEDRKCK